MLIKAPRLSKSALHTRFFSTKLSKEQRAKLWRQINKDKEKLRSLRQDYTINPKDIDLLQRKIGKTRMILATSNITQESHGNETIE